MIYYIGNSLSLLSDVETCTLNDAYEYLKDKKEIGLDIETTKKYDKYTNEGLDPYTSKIVMIQIGDLENQYIIDYRDTKTLGKLKLLLEDKNCVKVGHNIKFEYKHIFVNEGIKINNVYDTMIAEQILYNGLYRGFSLLNLIKNYFNIVVDKDIRLGFLTIGSRPFTKSEIQYGADDITYPLKIKKEQFTRICTYNFHGVIKLEMLFVPVLGDIEIKGINFNKKIWLDNYNKNKYALNKQKKVLDDFVIKNNHTQFIEKQLDLFSDETKCNINWGSSQQTIEFFKYLKICPEEVSKHTSRKSYTVNAQILKSYIKNAVIPFEIKSFVYEYLNYKELEQACSTFGENFLNNINPITNRIHSNYKQILNTGRISSGSPNLQNIPAKDEYRRAFDAPTGCKIVNADYSGQEQIILANKSLDVNLLEFYKNPKGDMHSFIASKIFRVNIEEIISAKLAPIPTAYEKSLIEFRQIAKAAGFAINYGGTGYTIAKNLGITEEVGNTVYDEYFKAFPGLKNYFKITQDRTLRAGYILIDNITNRKTFFDKPITNKEIGSIKRMALNFPIQGEAGSITKLAAIFFRQEMIKLKLDKHIYITNLVHDEINVECLDVYGAFTALKLEKAMAKAANIWCKTIPLKASAKVVDYWTH